VLERKSKKFSPRVQSISLGRVSPLNKLLGKKLLLYPAERAPGRAGRHLPRRRAVRRAAARLADYRPLARRAAGGRAPALPRGAHGASAASVLAMGAARQSMANCGGTDAVERAVHYARAVPGRRAAAGAGRLLPILRDWRLRQREHVLSCRCRRRRVGGFVSCIAPCHHQSRLALQPELPSRSMADAPAATAEPALPHVLPAPVQRVYRPLKWSLWRVGDGNGGTLQLVDGVRAMARLRPPYATGRDGAHAPYSQALHAAEPGTLPVANRGDAGSVGG
jgi:hypothetical protein